MHKDRCTAPCKYGKDGAAAWGETRRVALATRGIAGLTTWQLVIANPCLAAEHEVGTKTPTHDHRTATPFGAFAHDILAPNLSPTPGTDREGPTAVVKSFCKVDFGKLPCGTPLDLKIHPSCLRDEDGLNALEALLKTFVAGGGLYLQVDVVDAETLRDAQEHPERYTNLSVRVSGWSARFVTLSRDWQEMIIQRTEQYFN